MSTNTQFTEKMQKNLDFVAKYNVENLKDATIYGLDLSTVLGASAQGGSIKNILTALSGSVGASLYKGVLDCSTNPNYPAMNVNEYYIVSVAGLVGGAGGKSVEVGDEIVCRVTSASGTEAAVGANYFVNQTNITASTITILRTGTSVVDYVTPGVLATAFGGTSFTSAATPLFILGGTTEQIKLTTGAASKALTIDATTTDHTAGNLIDIDVDAADIAVGNLVAVNVNMDELVAGTNGTMMYGSLTTLTGFATGRADIKGHSVVIDGSKTGGDSTTGMEVVTSSFTVNNAGEELRGLFVDFRSFTNTSSSLVRGVDVNVDSTSKKNASIGLLISKGITNAAASGAIARTNGAIEIYSTNATTVAGNAMTISGYLNSIQEVNSTTIASADVYSGTMFGISYSATTTGAGTATNTARVLELDYNLNATFAGLICDSFNAAVIDFDTTGVVAYNAGTYNLLKITGNDAAIPTYAASCILNGTLIDVSGLNASDADLTINGIKITVPAAAGSNVVAVSLTGNATTGINFAGTYSVGIDFNAASVTTGSLIDYIAITGKTSGYLFNGSMTTSTLDASTLIDDFSCSCNHDGAAADTLRMIRRIWSGNLPQTGANADLQLVELQYSGTIGSGAAQGGNLIGQKIDMGSSVLDGTAVNAYGLYIDMTVTDTKSNSIYGAYITTVATADAGLYTDGYIENVKNAGATVAPAAGTITAKEYGDGKHHITVLTLTAARVGSVAAAAKAIGTQIYELPAGVQFYQVTDCRLAFDNDDTSCDTDDPVYGIGTVVGVGAIAVLNATLPAANDYMPEQTSTNCDGTYGAINGPVVPLAGFATGTIALNAVGAEKSIFLNCAETWTGTTNITATGTITLVWDTLE